MMEVRQPALSPRVSWGGVFAGFFTLLAVWAALGLLGAAVGFTMMGERQPDRGFGVGAGVWLILSVLLASFFGGFIAARLAGVFWRKNGVLHGLVVWSLGAVAALMLAGWGVVLANMWGGMQGPAAMDPRMAAMTAWWLFATVALSLVACLIGGALGAIETPRSRGIVAEGRREEVTPPPVTPPLTPRET